MKKTGRKILAFLVALLLMVTAAVAVFAAEEIDFDKYIAEYEAEDPTFKADTYHMNLGDTNDLSRLSGEPFGQLTLYSSDETVIAIDGLSVKAVGEGNAYVAYFFDGSYLYLRCYQVGKYSANQVAQLNGYDKLTEGFKTYQSASGGVSFIFVLIVCLLGTALVIELNAFRFSKIGRAHV